MKNNIYLTLMILLALMFIACSDIENSNLNIMSSQGKLKYKVIDSYKELDDDIKKDLFKYAFQKDSKKDIKYIDIGDELELYFDDITFDSITVHDTLLNEKGTYKYDDKLTDIVQITEKESRFFMTIDKNMASGLSSSYIEGQLVYRGYRIDINNRDEEKSYLFVIQTDSFN